MERSALLALLLTALLSGCTTTTDDGGDGDGTSTTGGSALTGASSTKTVSEDFDNRTPGEKPQGWTTHLGVWGAAENASDSAHPKVLLGSGQADPGLSSIVAPEGYTDFEARVSFKMMSGEHPQGAGLVFHVFDDDNYQIIRYSITENGWHLFTVIDGNREKQSSASVTGETHPGNNEWVDFRVESKGGHVTAFDGDTKVIDYTLPNDAAQYGGAGPFVRGNTIAVFDDFFVEPI